jgi:hypothetical protein
MTPVSGDEGEPTEGTESVRLARLCGDLLLLPDLTEAVSAASPLASTAELLGLSVLPEPGILERKERNDREDSLVSDLLKEGYDCSASSPFPAALADAALASLEAWLPMVPQCQRRLWYVRSQGAGRRARVRLWYRQGRL